MSQLAMTKVIKFQKAFNEERAIPNITYVAMTNVIKFQKAFLAFTQKRESKLYVELCLGYLDVPFY